MIGGGPLAAPRARAAAAGVFREEAGRVTAALMRQFGDFDIVEESVQDALLVALERWPRDGVPQRPGAWLLTVARRRALNRLDRAARYRLKLVELDQEEAGEADDRLRLIFTCCHPALSREAQVALTLRAVCGFTTQEIARAFLASESAVAQRIVRARRKIREARIPYRIPGHVDLGERLNEVLAVLYLMFNEGHLATAGAAASRDLAEDAAWLAALLCGLVPKEPEALGLLALMKLHLARADARFDSRGELVLLPDQDRRRWNRPLIAEAVRLIEAAAAMRRPGPYQIEAAIAACHAEAVSFEATDWPQIVALYDILIRLADTPLVRLNRAIALKHLAGPEAALAELDAVAPELAGYHLLHAARGQVLAELGQIEQARAAELRALGLTQNPAERSLLERRLFS